MEGYRRIIPSVDRGAVLARLRVSLGRCHDSKNPGIHALGTAIRLVEQNVSRALTLVHRAYVFESGKVIMQGTSAELANNKQVQAGDLGG